MTATLILALALALQPDAPYQDLTLEKGEYVFHIACENTNEWGPWIETEDGEYDAEPGQFVQFLEGSYYGWHDVVLKVGPDGGLLRSRANDPDYSLDKIWLKDDGTYRPGRYRVGDRPIGEWQNDVWPKAALTLRTSGSDVYATVKGSPAESVVLIGDDNRLYVYAQPGVQSRLMQDRPTVKIKGDRNRVYGYVQSQMTGIFVQGNGNRLIDLMVVIGPNAVGDDTGSVYFYGKAGNSGNRATRTTVVSMGFAFPSTHRRSAFYPDDNQEGAVFYDCKAVGFPIGIFGHGATNTRIDRFLAISCGTPVLLEPHFTTPDVEPTGNTVRRVTEIDNEAA